MLVTPLVTPVAVLHAVLQGGSTPRLQLVGSLRATHNGPQVPLLCWHCQYKAVLLRM
jgi:hypothetical protein